MYLGVEVPLISLYNIVMEIKDKNGNWIKFEKGDVIGDGFEEGMCVNIRKDEGDVWFDVYDMKEGRSIKLREVKSVNGDEVELIN